MKYLTKEQIVDDLYGKFTPEDVEILKSMGEDELGILHHGFGTNIRNSYNLWEASNPLTYDWFYDCAHSPDGHHKYMEDGVDCHPQHPDQVSFDIIKELHKKVKDSGQKVQA